ncbi:MAG TPA: hypothetical protein VJM33_06100, partial [Microthrixaceae bacterium]|nr:hypothetical protein [Microthrixaceae bacterium]
APALGAGQPAGFELTYDGSSLVTRVDGTLGYDAGAGAGPSVTLHLESGLLGLSGTVWVADPAAGVNVSATGQVVSFGADALGNVIGRIDGASLSIVFSTSSVAVAPGTDPALEALLATEATFCQDAQQRLAGLLESEVPLASIANSRGLSRAAFANAKSGLVPLATVSWADTTDVTTESGDHATISHHISCKTRAADHVATTGVTTSATDAPCSTLNQRSIDLALAQMTFAQQAAVTLPTLVPDIVRTTGSEWTTPLAPSVEYSAGQLRAHALLTRWNDPAFELFPDTIRGVHYCTTWSPAYAYTFLLATLP